MSCRQHRFGLAFVAAALVLGLLHAQEQDQLLTKDDETVLESLVRDFLFDPRGAERVQVSVKGRHAEHVREGWLVRTKSGNRVFFSDQESISAPAKFTKVDFIAKCKELFGGKPNPDSTVFPIFGFSPEYAVEHSALVHAAWLFRLGKNDLAAQAMTHVPKNRDTAVASLRNCLAQAALNRMVQFYERYQDEEALDEGARLLRLYTAEANELPQAAPLVQDLHRRKQHGLFGKKVAPELPKDFLTWERKKQLAYLVDSLAETQAHIPGQLRNGQYGLSHLPPHVDALLKLGESAVPVLLDVLDKDERMTRSIEGTSKWVSLCRVVPVREAAFALLCKILRVRHMDPRDPKAEDWSITQPELKQATILAREYWKEFGALPFEARMMRVLCDARSSFPALREAAKNLAGELKADDSTWPSMVKDIEPNPTVLRFGNPTAAEAIVLAMDRDLAHDDSLPNADHNRAYHEPLYFWALIRVGDRRIAPMLGERAGKETNALMRVRWAHASHRLGHSQPIRDFADQFSEGKITLATENGSPSRWQLEHIIEHLAAAHLPEADLALYKLVEPSHRYHDATKKGLIDRVVDYDSTGSFLNHPYCVGILRKLLDDTTATPVSLSIREPATGLNYTGGGSTGWRIMPAILADPKMRKTFANLRRCDLAAERCGFIAGVPEYHPLLKDADERLIALKKAIDGFPGKFRALTPAERTAVAGNTYSVWFGPDIAPLRRPATADDVKAGKAVFHLDGKGKVANMRLPARATWKGNSNEKPRHCLIVQAEIRVDGEILCGVVERDRIRAAPAREFAEFRSLERLKPKDDE